VTGRKDEMREKKLGEKRSETRKSMRGEME
jgi:hypothetical protein